MSYLSVIMEALPASLSGSLEGQVLAILGVSLVPLVLYSQTKHTFQVVLLGGLSEVTVSVRVRALYPVTLMSPDLGKEEDVSTSPRGCKGDFPSRTSSTYNRCLTFCPAQRVIEIRV